MRLFTKEVRDRKCIIKIGGIKFSYKIRTPFEKLYAKRFNKYISLKNKLKIIEKQFADNHHCYKPNILKPKTFNEKIQWLKLFNKNPLITVCADKYSVRDYVKEKIGEEYLIPLLGSWDNPEDIDFEKLPNEFVLKVNWGSGQNIIVRDKSKLNIENTIKQLNKWMEPRSNLYFYSFEFGYKNIKPKVICEKYIGELADNLTCYKFFNFSSKPYLIQTVFDEKTEKETVNYYDLKWNNLNFRQCFPNNPNEIPKPHNLDKLIELSEVLAQPFPYFVRIDFFELKDKILFSEFTFYSDAGLAAFEPVEWDYKLGDLIKLPVPEENK